LDRLRFPEGLLFVFPIIKFASVLALATGIRWRQMGRLTSAALVLYFVPAVAFQARAKDPISKCPARTRRHPATKAKTPGWKEVAHAYDDHLLDGTHQDRRGTR
jgi:hypothetical protein